MSDTKTAKETINMQIRKIILRAAPGLGSIGAAAAIVWQIAHIKGFDDLRWERWYRWPSRRIPIEIAARKTYEAVGDKAIKGVTPLGGDFVAARVTCIVIHAATRDILLYGVEPPSTRHQPISPVWCEAENLEWFGSDNVRLTQSENGHGYCKITITASDLKKHIAWVRGGMKDIEGATNLAAA